MNILKEEQNEYEEEKKRIKVYLKIKPSLVTDIIFYNISNDRKTISLLDNITLDDQKKSSKLEIDKIFTQKDENSYIYEEIMRNCIKDSLNGDNFTFISYGDSKSEKYDLIIGTPDCYENINNRGLLPRMLESFINKIDSNENLTDTISLNISYAFINNNHIIDLSQLMGRENKTLEIITKEELFKKYSKEIKIDDKNINYLKNIKKAPIVKANDSLFFILQILNLFYKLESTNNHFLTWSYFIIIIYITDNDGKTISTLSFIIMPGNEILLHRFQKKNHFGVERKDEISKAIKINAYEFFYASYDILEYLDIRNLIDDNEENKDKDKDIEKKNRRSIKSKLFHIFGNLAFDSNKDTIQYNRKYIIIGAIFGNSGLIINIKDTLNFLFKCQILSHQTLTKKIKKKEFFDATFIKEKLKVKSEQIFDLESKRKTQEAKLEELENIMAFKEENLKVLQKIYKKQIDILKEELGFHGEIENLLNGKKKSEEYEYALKIRTNENTRLKNVKIEELKQQIIQIESEIKQIKVLLDKKENDLTMMKIIRTGRDAMVNKRKEMDDRNKMEEEIENLKNKNKVLENKILGFKKEVNLKKKLLKQLPNIFKNNMNSKIDMKTFDIKINDIINDYSLNLQRKNKQGIQLIQNLENIEKDNLLNKYENLEKQNKIKIAKISNRFDNINYNFHHEKNKYLDELVFLYKSIINIIKLYRKTFSIKCSIFMNKEKFDKLLKKEEKYINPISFPLLYKELEKIGNGHFQISNMKAKIRPKIIKSKFSKNIIDEDNNNNLEDLDKKDKKTIDYTNKYKKDERIQKIMEQMKNWNMDKKNQKIPSISEIIENKKQIFKGIVKKTHMQFISMSKEELQIYSKKFTEKIAQIENFINNYIENINNIYNFEPSQEKISEIKEKLKYLNNKIKEISLKYQNNNMVFENGDKVIQRLKNENYLLRKQINGYDKNHLFSTLTPISHNKKFKKRTFSYKNIIKSNKLNNFMNYNSILTTANSSGIAGQYNIPINERTLMEQNFFSTLNDKATIHLNDNNHNSNIVNFYQKRPTSSFSNINSFYKVSENL